MKKLDSLSFVLPAYNEEKNIRNVIHDALKTLPQYTNKFEILVVDDGSKDKTVEIVNSIINDSLKIIKHSKKIGSGAAIWKGFLSARYDYIFYTDADGQFNISDLHLLIPFVKSNEIIMGYRKNRKDNLIRRIYGRVWNLLINLIFSLNVKDVNCAFKLFKKEVISKISIKSKGAFTNTEILVKARKLGYKWKEVEIQHYPRICGKQTGGKAKVIFKGFYELIRYYKDLK